MENANFVDIESLKKIVNLILDNLIDSKKNIPLTEDYYWTLNVKDIFLINQDIDLAKLNIGSLYDDFSFIELALKNNDSNRLLLMHLIPLLNYILFSKIQELENI